MKLALHLSLPALAAILVLAAPASARVSRAAVCPGAFAAPSKPNVSELHTTMLCLLNLERRGRGLGALRANRRLQAAADRHAADMVRRNYFSHDSLNGASFVDRILGVAYVSRNGAWSLGENIAYGTGPRARPAAIVSAWMRSPGHRTNILRGSFREIGVGISLGDPSDGSDFGGATYATDFGRRG
jgi:uncharacterized protein YkwD